MNISIWNVLLSTEDGKNVLWYHDGTDLSDTEYRAIVVDGSDTKNGGERLDDLVRRLKDRVAQHGRMCISFNNKLSYRKWFITSSVQGNGDLTLKNVVDTFERNGFMHSTVYVLSPRADDVSEIGVYGDKRHAGYIPKFRARIKELLLSNRLMRDYMEAYAVLASRSPEPSDALVPGQIEKIFSGRLQRIIVGKPHTIIALLDTAVVRIPLDRLSGVRCRMQNRILKSLALTSFNGLVPHAVQSARYGGYRLYGESKICGTGIDVPVASLDSLIVIASEFLGDFHRKTAKDIVVDEGQYRKLFARDFSRLRPYLSDRYRATLDALENILKPMVMGRRLRTVWVHGDYKLENVLIDMKKRALAGVIDWDLSRKEGLPLIDLIYLLFYNASNLRGENITEQVFRKIANRGCPDFENRVIDKYMHDVGIADAMVVPLLVMFWLHHFVHRYRQQLMECVSSGENRGIMPEIERGIEGIFSYIQRPGNTVRSDA